MTQYSGVMLSPARVSLHLDLFRHWDAKRSGRIMPARRDINPAEMPNVLPHVTIIDRAEGRFRYRLVGTAVSRDLGSDLTGGWVGDYVSPPEYAAAILAIYERVFDTAGPIFTTGEYRTASGTIQSISRLILPLSDDGTKANMVIFTRVARFNRNLKAGMDWLKGAPGKVCQVIDVGTVEEIEQQCFNWERYCLVSSAVA